MEIVSCCRTILQFELHSTQVRLHSQKFIVKYRLSDNLYCKYVHCVRKKVTPCVLFYNSGK